MKTDVELNIALEKIKELQDKCDRIQKEHDIIVEAAYKIRVESDRKTVVINMLKKRAINKFESEIAAML
jgi:hypothetical protein